MSRHVTMPGIVATSPLLRITLAVLLGSGSAGNSASAAGRWEACGGGPDGAVLALAEFDEPGDSTDYPALYAGGRFGAVGGGPAKLIARWRDGVWSPVGQGIEGESVDALVVFDEDGAGPGLPALYAAGDFDQAGEVRAQNIARWDGSRWSAVGGGLDGFVIDLAVFDEDHEGPRPPALFAVGIFDRTDDAAASHIAKWDGVNWSPVGQGLARVAYALAVGDPDGTGPVKPALVVGGMTTVDLWDGARWQSFGAPGFRTFALATFDHDYDGRSTLYAAGQIIEPRAGAPNTIARWEGKAWAPLPDALDERVYAMTLFDPDGVGPVKCALYVAGSFTKVGDRPAHGLARWDGENWSILEQGPRSDPLTPRMNCLAVFDRDSAGPLAGTLWVGGQFTLRREQKLRNVAGWSLLASEESPTAPTSSPP